MRKFIKPVDIIIALIILLASVLITCLFAQGGASYAVIYVNGTEFGRYSLPSNQKQIIEVSTQYGHNTVVVEKDKVWVSETTCKDKLEVNAGYINKSGQSLVCLPNRLVVTVEGRSLTDATSF